MTIPKIKYLTERRLGYSVSYGQVLRILKDELKYKYKKGS